MKNDVAGQCAENIPNGVTNSAANFLRVYSLDLIMDPSAFCMNEGAKLRLRRLGLTPASPFRRTEVPIKPTVVFLLALAGGRRNKKFGNATLSRDGVTPSDLTSGPNRLGHWIWRSKVLEPLSACSKLPLVSSEVRSLLMLSRSKSVRGIFSGGIVWNYSPNDWNCKLPGSFCGRNK